MYYDKFNKIKELARLHPELLEALTEQDLKNTAALITAGNRSDQPNYSEQNQNHERCNS